MLRDVAAVSTQTTLPGTVVASPVVAAPVAFLRLAHPEGEAALAAGVAATGGSDGVRELLATLNTEVEEALALAGARSPAEANADLIAGR